VNDILQANSPSPEPQEILKAFSELSERLTALLAAEPSADLDLIQVWDLLDRREALISILYQFFASNETAPSPEFLKALGERQAADQILMEKIKKLQSDLKQESQKMGKQFSATTSYLEQGIQAEETSRFFENQG